MKLENVNYDPVYLIPTIPNKITSLPILLLSYHASNAKLYFLAFKIYSN